MSKDEIADPALADVPRSESRIMTIDKVWKESGVVTKESADVETIEVRLPPEGTPLATVSYGASMTVNLGNFESLKTSVSLAVPCVAEEMGDAYRAAKKFVDDRMTASMAECRDMRRTS